VCRVCHHAAIAVQKCLLETTCSYPSAWEYVLPELGPAGSYCINGGGIYLVLLLRVPLLILTLANSG